MRPNEITKRWSYLPSSVDTADSQDPAAQPLWNGKTAIYDYKLRQERLRRSSKIINIKLQPELLLQQNVTMNHYVASAPDEIPPRPKNGSVQLEQTGNVEGTPS